jgi:hypothetical protein
MALNVSQPPTDQHAHRTVGATLQERRAAIKARQAEWEAEHGLSFHDWLTRTQPDERKMRQMLASWNEHGHPTEPLVMSQRPQGVATTNSLTKGARDLFVCRRCKGETNVLLAVDERGRGVCAQCEAKRHGLPAPQPALRLDDDQMLAEDQHGRLWSIRPGNASGTRLAQIRPVQSRWPADPNAVEVSVTAKDGDPAS